MLATQDFVLIGITAAGLLCSLYLFIAGYFGDNTKRGFRGLAVLSATCAVGYLFLQPLSDGGIIILKKIGLIGLTIFCFMGVIGIRRSSSTGNIKRGILWCAGIAISVLFFFLISSEINKSKTTPEQRPIQQNLVNKKATKVSNAMTRIKTIYKSKGLEAAQSYCETIKHELPNLTFSIQKNRLTDTIQLKVEYL